MFSIILPRGLLTLFITCVLLAGCQSTNDKESGESATLGDKVSDVLVNVATTTASKPKELWTLLGDALNAALGKNIEKHLSSTEKEKMQRAIFQALELNQDSTWQSDENNISGSVIVTNSTNTTDQVKVKVLKNSISDMPALDAIGSHFVSKNNINLRAGPGTHFNKVGQLDYGEIVTVVGQVTDKDWYLVSQGGVITGFVFSSLTAPVQLSEDIQGMSSLYNENDIQEVPVTVNGVCREVSQKVVLASGKTVEDKIKGCKGTTGWQIVS